MRRRGSTWSGLRGCGLAAALGLTLASSMGACGARSELELPEIFDEPGTGGGEVECEGFRSTAPPATLAVLFTLDTSGSMEGVTESGLTKWAALTQALSAYLVLPESSGQRVGMTYFPQEDWDVPAICFPGTGCGVDGGKCVNLGQCEPSELVLCQDDTQCPNPDDTCVLIGVCQGGGQCDPNNPMCGGGDCRELGYCERHTYCDSSEYEITALGSLPQDVGGIVQDMQSQMRDGYTPTLPALQGVVDSAIAWVAAHPNDKAVVAIATDGLPTLCDPSLQSEGVDGAFANLADVAAYGPDNGVATFVMGVFSPEEEPDATPRLDLVAAAGGTGSAFVVRTDEDVPARLLEAFSQITLANVCEFAIPEEGFGLDFARVKVSIADEEGNLTPIPRVENEAVCPPDSDGFYYDRPLGGDTPPGRIILCPFTCELDPDTVEVTCE